MARGFGPGCLFAAMLLLATDAAAKVPSLDAINDATFKSVPAKGLSPVVMKAQVLLGRARFSPGVVDGRGGENFDKAVAAFQTANQLEPTGKLDEATFARLAGTSTEPVMVEYTITRADVKGPFTKKIPARMEQMADLRRLGYRGPRELLAEKFHMDEDLLAALNRGKRFDRAGETILVAEVKRPKRERKATRIEIDRDGRSLKALAADGTLLAFYPASVGSEAKPAPVGTFEVKGIAANPTYEYNPDFNFKGVKTKERFTIAPGPNNPVGVVWIDLSADSYGIHGTPEPAKIGKTESHGCIRLTNWDASDLAQMVQRGAKVALPE